MSTIIISSSTLNKVNETDVVTIAACKKYDFTNQHVQGSVLLDLKKNSTMFVSWTFNIYVNLAIIGIRSDNNECNTFIKGLIVQFNCICMKTNWAIEAIPCKYNDKIKMVLNVQEIQLYFYKNESKEPHFTVNLSNKDLIRKYHLYTNVISDVIDQKIQLMNFEIKCYKSIQFLTK